VRVQKVGVTSNNQLDVPKNINDAAWYQKSATPGQGYGAVLIDGHNGGITRNGVFAKLNTLSQGDQITVERGDGKKYTYSVVENESMSLDEVNSTGMKKMMKSADEDTEGLSLITCDGKWIPKIQQFDRRIMLRAVLAA
jgi:LPXTG-site transpeptidase (sortase) family protein